MIRAKIFFDVYGVDTLEKKINTFIADKVVISISAISTTNEGYFCTVLYKDTLPVRVPAEVPTAPVQEPAVPTILWEQRDDKHYCLCVDNQTVASLKAWDTPDAPWFFNAIVGLTRWIDHSTGTADLTQAKNIVAQTLLQAYTKQFEACAKEASVAENAVNGLRTLLNTPNGETVARTAGRELWLRMGVSLDINKEEEKVLLCGQVAAEALLRRIVAEGRFRLDGDTYIPSAAVCDYNLRYGTGYDAEDINLTI